MKYKFTISADMYVSTNVIIEADNYSDAVSNVIDQAYNNLDLVWDQMGINEGSVTIEDVVEL